MKFIVDAQLPKLLSEFLNASGFESVHTFELPEMNRTKDSIIAIKANAEDRIVISKDADFLDGFLLHGKTSKLLLIKTGNLPNSDLLNLLRDNLNVIQEAFKQCNFVEVTKEEIISHK